MTAMFTFSGVKLLPKTELHRLISFSSKYRKSHYDSLGLTPKATQSDVKNAYYKLSMLYHPDKNKGSEEAAQKFRDITDAYEVLGNLKLRKLYDKGILHTAGPRFSTAEDDPEAKFYKSRTRRSKPPESTGRTPIYDFDEWTQAHYGNIFARDQAAKTKRKAKFYKETDHNYDRQQEVVFYGLGFILIVGLYLLQRLESYDVVKEEEKNKETLRKAENFLNDK